MRKIIDFHTHPFVEEEDNIKRYKDGENYIFEDIKNDIKRAGISMICGSVLHIREKNSFNIMKISNEHAMKLYRENPDLYMPGIQINPAYIKESCMEIENAYKEGVRLIGEINPARMDYEEYSCKGCVEILEYAQYLGMAVSCHSTTSEDMQKVASLLPNLNIVFAHPGEHARILDHIDRMKKQDNVYLDLSGTGLFRLGMLRYTIDKVSKDRILFGTDYPVCNPAMYVSGVLYEKLTDAEYDAIFYENAARLLQMN